MYINLWSKSLVKNRLEDLSIDGRTGFKWLLRKHDETNWAELSGSGRLKV
jgi:hypothetical protein